MERSGTFCQQAISTANLLLEAANQLETSSGDDRCRSNLTSLSAGSSRAPTNYIVTATHQAGANSTSDAMWRCCRCQRLRTSKPVQLDFLQYNWHQQTPQNGQRCCGQEQKDSNLVPYICMPCTTR